MADKKCRLGFNCQLMTGQLTEHCPNRVNCGSATLSELSEQERFEFHRIRNEQLERLFVTREQAAQMMLRHRGSPQQLEDFEFSSAFSHLISSIQQLESDLEQYRDQYIAPEHCEAHAYWVKRPQGKYRYNKLTAEEAIFRPSEKTKNVRVIHLSRNDDPRNIEARRGIERRNQLHQIQAQLRIAQQALDTARTIAASHPSEHE